MCPSRPRRGPATEEILHQHEGFRVIPPPAPCPGLLASGRARPAGGSARVEGWPPAPPPHDPIAVARCDPHAVRHMRVHLTTDVPRRSDLAPQSEPSAPRAARVSASSAAGVLGRFPSHAGPA
ncbi:unnamed protein product [Lampetra planeri]